MPSKIAAPEAAAALRRSGWREVAVEEDSRAYYRSTWVNGSRACWISYADEHSSVESAHVVFNRVPGGVLRALPTREEYLPCSRIEWSCATVQNDDSSPWYYTLAAERDGVIHSRTIDHQALSAFRDREWEFVLAVAKDIERSFK